MSHKCGLTSSVRQMIREMEFNPRSSHTKDSKNGNWRALLNTQHYKVRIKGKKEQSREWSSALHYISVL